MSDSLAAFAWKHAKKDQIIVICVTLLTFPAIWVTLELPKMIINDAMNGTGFPRYLLTFEFSQLDYLFLLCGAYLLVIAINNGLKFYLNVTRGITGERMLRRMRFDLFSKIMARRLNKLKGTSPGEVVQIISAELAPIGDFIGAIFATPLLQGGSFLVFISFIVVQNTFIGIAALSLYPVQAYVIPKLQARVVAMITQRLANLRAIAREISDSIDGVTEVRALRTQRWHLAIVSDQLYENYQIRRRIFILKNLIKFTNNVADHLTPFMIFLIGGYFVIQGQLNVGALTAVLIAYKDLSSPWRELLSYYQDHSDMSARYRNVMAQFADDANFVDGSGLAAQGTHAVSLSAAVFEGVHKPVDCHAPKDAVTMVVAENDSSRRALLQAMAGVLELDQGHWAVDDPNPLRAPVLVTADARIFTGTVRYNILHGLYASPVSAAQDDQAAIRRREAQLTGASDDDIRAQWIDTAQAGYANEAELEAHLLHIVRELDFEGDLYRFGLLSFPDATRRGALSDKILELRRAIAQNPDFAVPRAEFIDVWQTALYNPHGTLGENIFFARPNSAVANWDALAGDAQIIQALEKAKIHQELVTIGVEI
jgi:putative ABC transport system ATP-binding protein